MLILVFACDDDYIPEEEPTIATIEVVLPDSTTQEPDTPEVPAVVPPDEPVTVPVELSNVYLSGHPVKSIDFENDYVWATTDSFLVKLDQFNKTITYYPYPYTDQNGSSYNLKVDKNGEKWIARSEYLPHWSSIYESHSSSMYRFDENQWTKVKSIGYGEILSLAVDKNNNKWIATLGNSGVYVIKQDSCLHYTSANSGLVYNSVEQISSDRDGNIWLYNYGNLGGLISADVSMIRYDGDNWISYFLGRNFYLVWMRLDSQGNPWVQNPWIIQKLDTANISWSEITPLDINEHLRLQTIEGDRKFWYTRSLNLKGNGIAVYNGSDWNYYTTSNSNLPSDTVYQIAIDSFGTKWIGTANGLARLETIP
ncbi:ligand-binding sensor domain-containing protein [Mangrovibacterium lignilyticum]|uniref:hypothetical protein n=1 Tax=Mangrovibacterium lignilyticum TaxID=2668052 RepID=UPI0013D3832F|nr:hypothetical protein [Mangrovibacterium lignilyticum]